MKLPYLTTELMESRLKFFSPQNRSGASQQNSVSALSCATEEDGNLSKSLNKQPIKTQNGPWFDKKLFTPTSERKHFF